MIKMITIISIILMVQITQASQTTQKFLYKADDNVTILPNSTIEMTIELSTASDQYLGDSSVMTTLDIQRSDSTPIPYDILYFSYWLQSGEDCYKEWMVSGNIPLEIPCMTLVNDYYDNLPVCARYTDCSSEQINVTLGLQDQIFRYSYVLVQNSQSQSLDLQTCIKLELSSDNGWFYWGVGLTCFLLISLVVFAGFVFYWMLKYKRVKKMFEQFKLTEESIIKED